MLYSSKLFSFIRIIFIDLISAINVKIMNPIVNYIVLYFFIFLSVISLAILFHFSNI